MRKGIIVEVSAADRVRLEAVVADRNSPQKHVWRARIVLLTADGLGTVEIMRRAGTSKVAVWRWQERFMTAGVAGLLRDKTRPPRIPPLGADVAARVVALTTTSDPPGETTHWTAAAMAAAVGISASSVQRIRRAHGLQPHRVRSFKLSNDPRFAEKLRAIVGLYVDPPAQLLLRRTANAAEVPCAHAQSMTDRDPFLGYVDGEFVISAANAAHARFCSVGLLAIDVRDQCEILARVSGSAPALSPPRVDGQPEHDSIACGNHL